MVPSNLEEKYGRFECYCGASIHYGNIVNLLTYHITQLHIPEVPRLDTVRVSFHLLQGLASVLFPWRLLSIFHTCMTFTNSYMLRLSCL